MYLSSFVNKQKSLRPDIRTKAITSVVPPEFLLNLKEQTLNKLPDSSVTVNGVYRLVLHENVRTSHSGEKFGISLCPMGFQPVFTAPCSLVGIFTGMLTAIR
jgi:hypothetical protein